MKIDNFKHLKWDTDFFNFKVSEIRTNNISEMELKIILNLLKKEGYVLIYLFLNKKFDKKLSAYKMKLVDRKIIYTKKILKNDLEISHIIKYELNYPSQDLINLAIESGIHSRFNIDENIEKEKYQELYKQWIINSVNKKIAKEVLIYLEEGKTAGMVTLGEKNKKGNIGIIAVDEKYRGKKIASKLIHSAEQYFEKQGYSEMQVVTQSENKPACKLYERNGFKIDKTEYVYHIWL